MRFVLLLGKLQLLLLMLGNPLIIKAQPLYNRITDIDVSSGANQLQFPLAGGMNNPQFYRFDFDLNGVPDLFVFDRAGGIVMPYLNNGTAQVPDYRYDPTYENLMPAMKEWVVLADIDCDSLPDIITAGNESRVRIFKSMISSNSWQFQSITDTLRYNDNNFLLDVFVNKIDIPGVADINGDGDVDLLTFAPGGGYLEYFENQSVELYGDCTHFELELTDKCWGKFYESGLLQSVSLDSCQVQFTSGSQESDGLHVGSTVSILDLNHDGKKEAVLGDVTFDNLNLLYNDGTSSDAHIFKQDTIFPSNSVSALIPTFPAAFFLPVDGPMAYDMIVAPNSRNNSLDVQNVWFYRNLGNGSHDSFLFVQNNFLAGQSIDVGTMSAPVFFDANADGLQDLIIGRQSRRAGTQLEYGSLTLYENIGTIDTPEFLWVTDDYAGLTTYQFFSIYPTFGDIDDDGDSDMLIGESDGVLHLFKNNAGAGNPASFTLQSPNYFGIDIGVSSAPQLVDVDRDQLLDLVVGEKNGNLNYFRNTGSASVASFSATPDDGFFGQVDVRPYLQPFGYSTPYLYDPDGSGTYALLVGNLDGQVYHYSNIDNNLSGPFTLEDTLFNGIDVGERAAITGGLLNSDTLPEILIGNTRGGVHLYSKSFFSGIKQTDRAHKNISVFPNPASSEIIIRLEDFVNGQFTFTVTSIAGHVVMRGEINGMSTHILNTAQLPSGLYLLVMESDHERFVEKILILHE